MKTEVQLHKASISDLADLQGICKKTYSIYFGDHWEGPGLALYLEEQFGTDVLKSCLQDNSIGFYFIRFEGKNSGFLKIYFEATCEGFDKKHTCELEKMYILPEYKGMGIGKNALNILIDKTRKAGKTILFLDVLDSNEAAISFYQNLGFVLHSKFRLKYQYFKDELKGLNRMYLEL